MKCPNCQHENPPESRFCFECGTGLVGVCPSCGNALPPSVKFCNACGHDLSRPVTASEEALPPQPPQESPSLELSAPEGERRQATVMFSDLSGYTAMNERLDPEEVEHIMSRVKAEAVRIVESHGGIVNQFVGDEVLALFGIPTAHEDDPSRAVRAALELHELTRRLSPEVEGRIGQPLAMHTGINTGLIVTHLSDDRDGRYGITGDTVNTGARLKERAAHDEILVSPETRRLISPYFETEPLEPLVIKGKAEPISLFRVVGEAQLAELAQQAFVGRRGELRQFAGIVENCAETNCGQAIFVRGDAGIGKTRLVQELQGLASRHGFTCHTGLVLDFGVGKGQDAVRALVRSMLGIAGAGKGARREAVQQAVGEGLLDSEREPFLNDLLDVPQPSELRALYDAMDNDTRNRGKRETIAELVRRMSARAPMLLVIEDVHWADGLTLAHLAELTATVADVPAVLVITSRIAGDPLDQAWRGATRGSPLVTIDLGPLRREEALALAGEFFEVTNQVAINCVERAEGNPLFLEQLLRSAEETAGDAMPGTIQSLVLARMDRLEPRDKGALQAASILGQRFSLDGLCHLIGDPAYTCAGPIAHYLLRPEGEDFLFAHALVQEGVYNSVLKSRRRELHRRAAEWFAGRDAVLRAVHFDRAEDTAAPLAYLGAAEAQAAEFHYERALNLVERGLELAADQSDKFALTCFQGQILHDLGSTSKSIEAYENALTSATDEVQRCQAWIGLAAGMRIVDKYKQALETLDKAQAAATPNGLTLELARIHHLRGNIFFPMGNLDGCLEQHELALRHAQHAGSPEMEANALSGLGDAYYQRGRMQTACNHFRRCIDLCREHGYGRIEVANFPMVGWTVYFQNELEQALEIGLAAAEMAAKVSHQRAEQLAHSLVGFLQSEFIGDYADAAEYANQAIALVRNLKARRFEPLALGVLTKSALAAGDRSCAVELVKQGLEISREIGTSLHGPWLLGILAMVTDTPDERQRALAEGENLLRHGCVGHNYLWFYRDAMEVCLNTGDWDAVARYAAALEEYTRPEPLPWSDFFIARGRALAAHGRGRQDDALLEELKGLREEADRVGLKLALPALEQALASFSSSAEPISRQAR